MGWKLQNQLNQSAPNHPPIVPLTALDNRCSERQSVSENPSTPSDHNNINWTSMEEKVMTVSDQFKSKQPFQQAVRIEMPSELDPNIDQERVKQILASRYLHQDPEWRSCSIFQSLKELHWSGHLTHSRRFIEIILTKLRTLYFNWKGWCCQNIWDLLLNLKHFVGEKFAQSFEARTVYFKSFMYNHVWTLYYSWKQSMHILKVASYPMDPETITTCVSFSWLTWIEVKLSNQI